MKNESQMRQEIFSEHQHWEFRLELYGGRREIPQILFFKIHL